MKVLQTNLDTIDNKQLAVFIDYYFITSVYPASNIMSPHQ